MKIQQRKRHTKRRSKRGGEIDSNLRDDIKEAIKNSSNMNSKQLSDIISRIKVARTKLQEDLDKENKYINHRWGFRTPLRPESRKRLSDKKKTASLLENNIKYLDDNKNFLEIKEFQQTLKEDAERQRLLEEEAARAYAAEQQKNLQERMQMMSETLNREEHINDWVNNMGRFVKKKMDKAQADGMTEQELFDFRDTVLKELPVEEPYSEHKQAIKETLIKTAAERAETLIGQEAAADKAAADKAEEEEALRPAEEPSIDANLVGYFGGKKRKAKKSKKKRKRSYRTLKKH